MLFLIRPMSNFSGPYLERQWPYFIRSHNNCDPILRYKINLICLNMNATNVFTCYRQHNYHNFSGNVQRRTISMIYYRCFRQTFPSIAEIKLIRLNDVSLNCVVICHALIQYTHLFLKCLRCMISIGATQNI